MGRKGAGNLPQPTEAGRAADKVASSLGIGRKTYEKAKAVVEAAKDNPALAPLVDQMNATGKVDAAFRELQRQRDLAGKAVGVIGLTPGPGCSSRPSPPAGRNEGTSASGR